MEEKEGMNSSGVAVKGDDASESFRVEPSVENPSQFSGSAVTTTEAAPISDAVPATEVKKKRGRPRKYGPDGSINMALSPMPISASIPLTGDFSAWKQGRGRPIDSYKKKHKLEFESSVQTGVAYSVGANFIPHIITVNAGEDVTMKIISFSQQGSRAICVLAANGSISNVTLYQPNSSGGTLTYEGRFELLSLTGSFMPNDNGVTKSRSGGMSVSLAGPDGRVLGGGLAGMLVAAGAVQVVIGSFLLGHQQEQKPKKQKFEQTAAYAAIPAHPLSDERAEGAYSAPKPTLTSAASFHPPSDERAEGAYSAPKPSLTSAASFHGDDVVSINAMHTKISTPDSIISAPAAEYKDQSQSKCEVSC